MFCLFKVQSDWDVLLPRNTTRAIYGKAGIHARIDVAKVNNGPVKVLHVILLQIGARRRAPNS
jgi:hypothetical protein